MSLSLSLTRERERERERENMLEMELIHANSITPVKIQQKHGSKLLAFIIAVAVRAALRVVGVTHAVEQLSTFLRILHYNYNSGNRDLT